MNISEINLYASEFISYLESKGAKLTKICDEIEDFLSKIESSEYFDDIRKFLFALPISPNDKIDLLKNFTKSEELLKLCEILAKKSKLQNIFAILHKVIAIHNDKNHIKNVKVFSVVKITDEQIKKINLLIKKRFLCDAKIENIIDKSIIGGFVIEIESYSLDLSIRNQLNIIERKVFA